MKLLKAVLVTAGLFATAVTVARAEDVHLQGGGSTFVNPMMQRWVTEYQRLHPEAKIDYSSIGSGGGIKGLTDKTFDFGASDAPLSKKEKEKLGGPDKVVEVPVIAGCVVLAYNLPGLQAELKLDGPVTAEIFLGAVKNWSDPKIAALNPGLQLPNLPITTAHRTDGSGTTYVFTSYLGTQSEEFRNKIGGAKSVDWPNGTGGPGNAGVAAVIKATKGAIGYVELAYAMENKIAFAQLKNKDGEFVRPSIEGVSLAGESAVGEMKTGHLAANIWNQPGKEAYPISAFTYVIVYKDLNNLKDETRARTLVGFLQWATTDGEKLAPPLNYASLAAGVQAKVGAELNMLTFNGKPISAAK